MTPGNLADVGQDQAWRDDAECDITRTTLDIRVWDAEVDGETPLQRQVRHVIAKHVCRTRCPVRIECLADAQDIVKRRVIPGIRGGELFE